jgi:hypothetical protein
MEGPQVGRTPSTVRPHRDRDLGYSGAKLCRFDQRFRAEFKAYGPKVETAKNVFGEASHPTVDVPDPGTEKKV